MIFNYNFPKKTMETLDLKKVSIVLTRNYNKSKLEIQERIVQKADEMFRRYGIKSVTMDDISKQLGVSKKTLYQYYPDKNELVGSVMELNLTKQRGCMDSVCGGKSANAVEELLNVEKMMLEIMQGINPSMLYDMQKYHPQSWFQYTEFKEKYALAQIKENLSRGIEEGLYRPNLNIDVAAKFRLATIDMAFSGAVFNPQQYTLQEIMKQLTDLFLHGLVTLKGHKMINKYRNLKEEE
jgi:TetR/AcrR family transcriptional regulator, cholesterol catabolism regulator